jgi:hypothetical protein
MNEARQCHVVAKNAKKPFLRPKTGHESGWRVEKHILINGSPVESEPAN